MAFSEAFITELMNKNDIVSVISEYTLLKSKGSRMWGLCPFHPEKDASFSVSPDKQLFHCFSCKAGGSVIQFIMQAENLPYIDAIRFLAQRAGMDMPDEVDDAKLRADKMKRDRLYKANREAAKFYHSMLMSDAGAAARRYLIGRGIDGNTAVKFGLGYAPADWDALFKHMTKLEYKRDDLIDAGLCVKGRKDENATFDFFHDRLMFPVIAANGTVIAFGGRIIGNSDGAKYMNTGDTLIYNKKHNVYGINLMKGRKLSELIMVEGYMDVISLHQAGIDNAVASLGTALTSQQARLMSRFAPRVLYAYDGDGPGQNAMLRGVDVLAENGVEPRVIVIPEGKDPDDFVKAYGAEAFLKLKDSSITAPHFKLEYIASKHNLDTDDGREEYVKKACKLLSALEPVELERYGKLVSERSGMSMEVIRKQCGDQTVKPVDNEEKIGRPVYKNSVYAKTKVDSERTKAERLLLASMMISRGETAQILQINGFSCALFREKAMADFANALINAYGKKNEVDLRMIMASMQGDSENVSAAMAMLEEIEKPIETAEDCIRCILKLDCEERILQLSSQIEKETDHVKRTKLLREQMELIVKSKQK